MPILEVFDTVWSVWNESRTHGFVSAKSEKGEDGLYAQVRGLDMVMNNLSVRNESARDGGATSYVDGGAGYSGRSAHERAMNIDNAASAHSKNSFEQVKWVRWSPAL